MIKIIYILLILLPYNIFAQSNTQIYGQIGWSPITGILGIEIKTPPIAINAGWNKKSELILNDVNERNVFNLGVTKYLKQKNNSPYISIVYSYNGLVDKTEFKGNCDITWYNTINSTIGYKFGNEFMNIKIGAGVIVCEYIFFDVEMTFGLKLYEIKKNKN